MKILYAVAAIIFLFAIGATAQTTNGLSDAEIQGRNLAKQLYEMRPTESSTNNGALKIYRGNNKTVEIPIGFRTTITETNWQCVYNIHKIMGKNAKHPGWTSLVVVHDGSSPNQYRYYELFNEIELEPVVTNFTSDQTMMAFADSDFWICDLGLEFFHWPEQKILKKEVRRSRGCDVLESTNPNPSTNGYSRVISWIDEESGGIVEAKAYDAQGKLLKEFYPKDVKKVNGQWQVEMMEMDNVQTGSRSRIEFDLKQE
jgi:hypothetical protein